MATGDVYPCNTFSVDFGGIQVETLQNVSTPSMQIDVVETRQVSATGEPILRKQPAAHPQGGEITVTRGMDKSKAFTDWINTALEKKDIAKARQNVTIVQYDVDKKPVLRYHLSNAWASQLKCADLDASSTNAATEQVTITYEECTMERP
ncbi:phage tail protein [Streptomyces sp. FIT100]|uniref:phage tail protein n=1 Tax=Streptomyces sp. FIT100 TaxID=2837956 RepID=UPI0021C98927|nr:phage tail protein [Streptomyces sp. FIT100]UUN30786.1 phage tail protein [Streptomyces sp. FIT100]